MRLDRRAAVLGGLGLALAPFPTRADERTLQIVSPWEIASLEPARAGYVFTRLQVTETLMEADDGGLPLPGLAASWSIGDDGLTWRFVLRPDVRFHDGTPLTAVDVVRCLEAARIAPAVLANVPIQTIIAEPGAVVVRTTEPFTALPAFLAHTSTQILAPASFGTDGAVKAVIGTGPYRITSIEPPQKLELQMSEHWRGPAPAVRKVAYLAVGRAETRALMAEGGQADLSFTLDPASFTRLSAGGTVSTEAVTIPRTILLKLNAGHPLLADVRARRALALALERQGMAKAILRASGIAATQLFPPTLAEWHVQGVEPLRTDPAAASGLLAELGWKPGVDGILVRGDQRFALTLRTFPDRPELPLLAAAIQDQLKQVGIALAVAVGNSSEIPAGHKDGTLELGLLARNFSLVPDPIGTMLSDFGEKGGDWGAMGWSSPELIGHLRKLGRTSDPAERAAARGAIARILQAELPVVPIAWYRHTVAVAKRVRDVSIDPLERSYRIGAMRWSG